MPRPIDETLGILLKNQEDIQAVRGERLQAHAQPRAGREAPGHERRAHGLADNLLLFGRVLRAAGLDVHHGRLLDAVRALEWVDVGSRADVARRRCEACSCTGTTDIARFDEAFDLFFRAHRAAGAWPAAVLARRAAARRRPARAGRRPLPVEIEGIEAGRGAPTRGRSAPGARAGVSRTKDFAEFTRRGARARASAAARRCPGSLSLRRTRRWQRASSGAVDLRPLLRRNVMRGGDLVDLPRRERRETAAPDRAARATSADRWSDTAGCCCTSSTAWRTARTRVEAFLFATRLTRVTRHADRARRGADGARAASRATLQDWGGGTRIGEALRSLQHCAGPGASSATVPSC